MPREKGDLLIDFSLKNMFGDVILKQKNSPVDEMLTHFRDIGLRPSMQRLRKRRKGNSSMILFIVIFATFSAFVLTTVYYKDAAFEKVCDPHCPEAWQLQVSPTLKDQWDQAIQDNKSASIYLVPAIFTLPFMVLIPILTRRRQRKEINSIAKAD